MGIFSGGGSGGGGGVTVLSYVEFTAPVAITATVEATPTTIVTAGAITVSGTQLVCVEFFSTFVQGDSGQTTVTLWEGATELGRIGLAPSIATLTSATMFTRRYLTPSAGSHTYFVAAHKSAGSPSVSGGLGGTAAYMPGYVRVTSGG